MLYDWRESSLLIGQIVLINLYFYMEIGLKITR